MNATLLTILALGVVSLGVTVTYVLATLVPMGLLTTAQEHGRFAGLGSEESDTGIGSSVSDTVLQPRFLHA
ncbi:MULTISPECIES: hypothetical protein [unclassified Cupriavidus]|uniref:hypothetical protein n=1 Tax=unclassified Cupriavidus TaxID=2640874 RepID=UPI0010F559D1|nr:MULTISPECIES: hypothetical protein [unclassified Cupriavidus]MWL89461.1 hypothetical protein [Cupriavidus sp. SW-Y-13]